MSAGSRLPIVDLYCLCWNEAAIIPHFLRHYDSLVRAFFIHDNHSTDASLALLQAHPRVTTTSFDVDDDSFIETEQRLSDAMWKACLHGSAPPPDWVIVVDMDEFLFHPDLPAYLRHCTGQGVTAIRALGYDMVSETFPSGDRPLHYSITRGVRSPGHDKPCLFDPKAITETCFTIGRHGAHPKGDVRWPRHPDIALLHYKHLGLAYTTRRNRALGTGLKHKDVANGWGRHYLRADTDVADDFWRMHRAAVRVPGLPGGLPAAALGAEERRIRAGSRFAADWYLAAYPDVAAAGFDPVAHFHHYGWREARLPHPGCNPALFLAGLDRVDPRVGNPFLEYLAG